MPCSNSSTAFSKAPSCPTRTIATDMCKSNDGGRNTLTELRELLLAIKRAGLLPARFISSNNSRNSVKVLRPPSLDLHMSVAIVRVGQLGALEKAVELLEHGIRRLFQAANTAKPLTK